MVAGYGYGNFDTDADISAMVSADVYMVLESR